MQKTKFQIKGMHCQSCVTLIEEKLKNQPGVMIAKVNFDSKKAVVVYDERKIKASQFPALVQAAGDYQIEVMADESEEEPLNQDNNDSQINKSNKKLGGVFQNALKSSFILGLVSGLLTISLVLNFYFIFSDNKNGAVAGINTEVEQKLAAQNIPPADAAAPETIATFDISKDNHVRGDFNAPITLVEFSDFECPFCERHYPTLNKILENYKGKVRLVYKHFPLGFHPNAQKAAEASECADEQGKFWEYHDKLFDNQPTGYSLEKFKQWAKDLGLNSKKFNDCLDSAKFAEKVQADYQEGTEKGVNGTPANFVNGELISGAQPYELFKQTIDQLLKQ